MTIRKVTGKVLREDGSPFRDTEIQIWDRDFGLDDKLGSGRTNDQGQFNIAYDTEYAGDKPDMTVKVMRLNAKGDSEEIYDFDGPKNVTTDYDFGDIKLSDWEYDSHFRVPLVRAIGSGVGASPQNFVPSQFRKLLLKAAYFMAKRLIANSRPTIAEAQEIFPSNLTIDMEKNQPGSSRDDQFLSKAILNGFNPAMLTKDSVGAYHVRYNLDKYEWDLEHQSASVHLTLKKDLDDNLVPVKIEYKIRKKGSNPAVFELSEVATAEQGGLAWDTAKNHFRVSEFIDGEIKGHLGRSHLNVGQYAIALYRNIQKSPIFKLLHPHLKGVSAINTAGRGVIFGSEGALAIAPLTDKSLIEAMRDDLGQCNWKDWSPRGEINKQHTYAKIQKLYWDLLYEYIDRFFLIYGEKIRLDWKEVYYFSQDLVQHSVPFYQYPLEPGETWYDDSEINAGGSNGRAISSITDVKTNPPSQDIENLKQVCAYVIYHGTLWHTWRNDSQVDYGGEIDYARFAMDYDVSEASFQLFIVHLLVGVKHGYLTKNEENDIPREFVALLKAAAPSFEEIGYDVRDIRSRINI